MPSKYRRKQNIRKAKRIFICCEDKKKAPDYFKEYLSFNRITESDVMIIQKFNTRSSPNHVLNRIEEFKKELKDDDNYFPEDEFWLVVDVDRWRSNLSQTIRECEQKEYLHAVSNPCFEIWFLLHYTDGDIIDTNPSNYNKRSINITLNNHRLSGDQAKDFFPKTEYAIANAEHIDISPEDRWTQNTGTRIYILMKELKSFIR